jgi:hypothetical protein
MKTVEFLAKSVFFWRKVEFKGQNFGVPLSALTTLLIAPNIPGFKHPIPQIFICLQAKNGKF